MRLSEAYGNGAIGGEPVDVTIAGGGPSLSSFPEPIDVFISGGTGGGTGGTGGTGGGAFGLAFLDTDTLAEAKTLLALAKGDVDLGNVANTADGAKVVLSASKLTTARRINGVLFDGTADIVIEAAGGGERLPAGLDWGGAVTATGTGVSQDIVLPETITRKDQIQVYVDGVRFHTNSYVVTGNTLTLTTYAVGSLIEVIKPIAAAASGTAAISVVNVTATATGGAQPIALPDALAADQVFFHVNGVQQMYDVDYTMSGATLTVTSATAGDHLLARYYVVGAT